MTIFLTYYCNDCHFTWQDEHASDMGLSDECRKCGSSDLTIEDDDGNDY